MKEYDICEGDDVILTGPDLNDENACRDFSCGFYSNMQKMVGETVTVVKLRPYKDNIKCFTVTCGECRWTWDERYAIPVYIAHKDQLPGQMSIEEFGLVVD